MPTKTRTAKSPSKVKETLANAATMFQAPAMSLATNTGLPVNASILMQKTSDAPASRKSNYMPVHSTIMCPW